MELKPCPFCGRVPDKTPIFNMGYIGDGVRCLCGARTPRLFAEHEAFRWWNRRAEDTRLSRLIERLEKVVSDFKTGRDENDCLLEIQQIIDEAQ